MGNTRPFVFILLLSLFFGTWQIHPLQTQAEQEYFDETGHWVTNEFLTTYHSVPNPDVLYGFPITDAFPDPTTHLLIQYFEKARFELHTDQPAGQRVQLSPLGEYLYVPGQPLPTPQAAACRQIAGTAFQVCYAFLEFFDANGGVQQFGNPISNLELQNDRMVQYFQRACFEWRPDLPAQQRVALARLGRQYFDMRGEDPLHLTPQSNGDVAEGVGVLRLRARAYPVQAVTGRKAEQTVYILVQDQRLLAVKNISVSVDVHLPSGKVEHYDALALTDARGVTSVTFPIDSSQIGTVKIQVHATRDAVLSTQTVTSFRIWW